MAERVDHVAEALSYLESNRVDAVARAQVHATLALVEQQRAAGLIAIAAMQVEAPSGEMVGTTLDGIVWMRTEASTLLGVPDVLPRMLPTSSELSPEEALKVAAFGLDEPEDEQA